MTITVPFGNQLTLDELKDAEINRLRDELAVTIERCAQVAEMRPYIHPDMPGARKPAIILPPPSVH